jgi:phosphoribosylformylglycinamidine synthase
MTAVKKHAQGGGRVLGICNGFQILCESGLLPGALLENVGRVFLSQFVHLSVGSTNSFFTKRIKVGDVISCPIAHFQGNYFADEDTLKNLEVKQRVVFRYCDSAGVVAHDDRLINVNGSAHSIAGVCSEDGNVVGMMPHPERATELLTGYIGGDSGLSPFASTTANS